MDDAPNAADISELHILLDNALAEGMKRGWHGEVTLRVSVQDGRIQIDSALCEAIRKMRPRKRKSPST